MHTSLTTHIGRRARLGAVTAGLLAALTAAVTFAPAASAQEATSPVYPDLRMPSPSELRIADWPVAAGVRHKQVRFTTTPANYGRGAVEIQRVPDESGIAELRQRIYHEPAGFGDQVLAQVAFAPADTSFVIPDIARYELWDRREFEKAQARGFRRGQPLQSRDVSHCIRDFAPNSVDTLHVQGIGGPYNICSKFVQGISAGWRTHESWADEDQYFDFGPNPPPDGDYVIRATVDPYNLVFESEGKADVARESEVANSGLTYFRVIGGQLAGIEPL